MSNTHPNTPFGHLFDKLGVWHPKAPDTIKAIIDKLQGAEPAVVLEVQAGIALLKANLGLVPAAIFDLIGLNKEEVAEKLDELAALVLKIAAKI